MTLPLFTVAAIVGQGSGWIGEWAPGIGDPTPIGWITTVVYVVAAAACWWAWQLKAPKATERWLWLVLALLLTALGINKQLDLQSAFTEILRLLAYDEGWYVIRRHFQEGFILTMVLWSVAALGGLFWLTRGLKPGAKVAAVGMVLVVAYVVVRAASFHYVDLFINTSVFGVKFNWVLELGGLFIILGGVGSRLRSLR